MYSGLILFLIPIFIYVVLFSYETILSLKKALIRNSKRNYVEITWEMTHTLLIIGLILYFVFYSDSLYAISEYIFPAAFIAGSFLVMRGILYTYIFYVSKDLHNRIVDWLFFLSHLGALASLGLVATRMILFVVRNHPSSNSNFLPYFIPGEILTLALILGPMYFLYRIKD